MKNAPAAGSTIPTMVPLSFAAGPGDHYANALFKPSESMLLAEQRGRVTIYDGLEHADVDRALDTQFDRIGSRAYPGNAAGRNRGD